MQWQTPAFYEVSLSGEVTGYVNTDGLGEGGVERGGEPTCAAGDEAPSAGRGE